MQDDDLKMREWRDSFPLLRELIERMSPLFQVMLHNSAPFGRQVGTTYIVLVPPPDSVRCRGVRVNQQDVRAHIMVQNRQPCVFTRAQSMLDAGTGVRFEELEPSPPSREVSPRSPPCHVNRAQPEGRGGSSNSPSPQFVGSAKSVSSSSSMAMARAVEAGPSVGWKVFVNDSESPLTVQSRAEIPSRDGAHVLYLLFVDGPLYKPSGQENQLGGHGGQPPHNPSAASNRMSMIPAWYQSQQANGASATVNSIAEEAHKLRAELNHTVRHPIPENRLDAIMLAMDTELEMFVSSYSCVKGFERYTVARVNQMAETAIEDFLSAMDDRGKGPYTSTGSLHSSFNAPLSPLSHSRHSIVSSNRSIGEGEVTTSTPFVQAPDKGLSEEEEEEELIDDETREMVIVGLHTIVTSKVANVLLAHWRVVHEVEDYAFFHACKAMNGQLSVESCLADAGVDALNHSKDWAKELTFHDTIQLVIDLDHTPLGVLPTLRVMEAVVSSIVSEAKRHLKCDVTADLCIPFTVFVLSRARPTTLPSLIRFVHSFMLDAFETSALCYALTTFEAAVTQLLHEYTELVLSR